MARRTLIGDRVAWLLEQLEKEHGYGWQTKVERETGVKQTTLSKLRHGDRNAGASTMDKLAQGLGIDREYFINPRLGKRPDYTRFKKGASVVEREDEKRGIVRHWLESEDASLVTPSQAERLLSVDWGGVEPDAMMVHAMWQRMDAQDRRRALPERAQDQAPQDLGDKRRIT